MGKSKLCVLVPSLTAEEIETGYQEALSRFRKISQIPLEEPRERYLAGYGKVGIRSWYQTLEQHRLPGGLENDTAIFSDVLVQVPAFTILSLTQRRLDFHEHRHLLEMFDWTFQELWEKIKHIPGIHLTKQGIERIESGVEFYLEPIFFYFDPGASYIDTFLNVVEERAVEMERSLKNKPIENIPSPNWVYEYFLDAERNYLERTRLAKENA